MNLSSDYTSGIKTQLFVLSLIAIGCAAVSVFLYDDVTDVCGYIFVCLAISYNGFRVACFTKSVSISIDNTFLYVADKKSKIRIPISEIVCAKQTFFMRLMYEYVMIIFKSPSEFGDKIIFFPEKRFPDISEIHPVVGMLNSIVRSHRQKTDQSDLEDTDS